MKVSGLKIEEEKKKPQQLAISTAFCFWHLQRCSLFCLLYFLPFCLPFPKRELQRSDAATLPCPAAGAASALGRLRNQTIPQERSHPGSGRAAGAGHGNAEPPAESSTAAKSPTARGLSTEGRGTSTGNEKGLAEGKEGILCLG